MSKYTEAVEENTKGLEALSFGLCPGCSSCALSLGFRDTEDEDGETIKTAEEAFNEAYEAGKVSDEGGFSRSECGLCGSRLGGDRFSYHFINHGNIVHGDDGCSDCRIYISYGDEPESSR